MPIVSQAQRGLFYATEAGADTGVPKSVAREFIAHDKPGKLPEHVRHKEGGLAAGMAGGGLSGIPTSADMPSWTRSEAREINMPHGGYLNSGIAGRTDRIPASVAPDSFVIPADVVSGVGQGNSNAGARFLSKALKVGPWGVDLPAHRFGSGPPRPPPVREPGLGYREGGGNDSAKVLLAGGEMVVPPHRVLEFGGGDMAKGHAVMRQMVKNVRAYTVKRTKALPSPKK